jgi:hypothetical protein
MFFIIFQLTYTLTNEKGFSFYKGSEPVCNFIKNDKLIYPDLLKFSNLPEPGTCPILKGNYTVNNMHFDVDRYPTLPPGPYQIKASYSIKGRVIGGYLVKANYKV